MTIKCVKKKDRKFYKVWFNQDDSAEATEFSANALTALRQKMKKHGVNIDQWERNCCDLKYAIADLKVLFPISNNDNYHFELGVEQKQAHTEIQNDNTHVTINEAVKYKITGLDAEWKLMIQNRTENKYDILKNEYELLPTLYEIANQRKIDIVKFLSFICEIHVQHQHPMITDTFNSVFVPVSVQREAAPNGISVRMPVIFDTAQSRSNNKCKLFLSKITKKSGDANYHINFTIIIHTQTIRDVFIRSMLFCVNEPKSNSSIIPNTIANMHSNSNSHQLTINTQSLPSFEPIELPLADVNNTHNHDHTNANHKQIPVHNHNHNHNARIDMDIDDANAITNTINAEPEIPLTFKQGFVFPDSIASSIASNANVHNSNVHNANVPNANSSILNSVNGTTAIPNMFNLNATDVVKPPPQQGCQKYNLQIYSLTILLRSKI